MDYFTVGKIVNTHGIKGEVKVYPTVDDLGEFEGFDRVFLDIRGKLTEYPVEGVRVHKGMVLLKLEGVDSMTAGEALKNTDVKITRDMASPCGEDEYYIKDLYGMAVFDDHGKEIGEIKDILFTGANDVYVIKTNGRDILLPAIKQCVLSVNAAENKMVIHLLEGLVE